MKKVSAAIVLVLMLLAVLGACKKVDVTPTVSPNVPVVSESPAIPSPSAATSPAATGSVSPAVSPTASPAATK